MADYRMLPTETWTKDEWFSDLDTAGKLLWVWMQTNDQAEKPWQSASWRRVAHETNIDGATVDALLEAFAKEGRIEFSASQQVFRIFVSDLRCANCGAGANMTVDHVKPRSWGGSNDPDNLQWLCRNCNSSKGNRHDARY